MASFVWSYHFIGRSSNFSITISGVDLWTSGVILPITGARGSSEAALLEQGKILMSDTKLYIDGRINTSGTWKLGLGNPALNTDQYSLLVEGVTKWSVNAVPVLKKVFIRHLPTGSLIGET